MSSEASSAEEPETPRNWKNKNYISWGDYFMATAVIASMRSKDPHTQVGACVVNKDNKIVGVGYNGFPKGCSDDKFSWRRKKESPDHKGLYVCHAEVNALLNRNCCNTKDCTMYVTLFPCNECTKFIIQCGIKEIIYLKCNKLKYEYDAAEKMLKAAEVKLGQFETADSELITKLDDLKDELMMSTAVKRFRPDGASTSSNYTNVDATELVKGG